MQLTGNPNVDDARNGEDGASVTIIGLLPGSVSGGAGGAGGQPGGSAGGNGGGASLGAGGQTGAGAGDSGIIGTVVITFTSASAAALTVTGGTDVVTSSSGVMVGAPFFNFGTTDHSRQEVIRRINFREFGANSAFATLGTSDADNAFTLDDGTTTLVARDAASVTANGLTGLSADTNGAITITFVGTGLDVVNNRTGPLGAHTVSVDGLSIGTLPTTQPIGVIPIVSGLSYGTHTVSFLPTGAPRISIVDFIIYGPKKPEIPTLDVGSLELSDYNIMADYDDTLVTSATNLGSISSGVLRKPCLREFLYNGTVTPIALSSSVPGSATGQALNVNTSAGLSYTFYGTGIELIAANNGDAINRSFTISVDGTALGTRFTTTTLPTGRYTSGTSLWNTQSSDATTPQANRLKIEGMPLGVHTITADGANNGIAFVGADVITPIHINDSNLKVGSEGLNNLTVDPVVEEDEQVVLANRGEAKAWLNFDMIGNTSGEVLGSLNVSAVIQTSNSRIIVYLDKPFKDRNYVIVATGEASGTPAISIHDGSDSQGLNVHANSFTLTGNTVIDNMHFAAFGELIDE